jgi:acetylornithine/N-succinyldiaminopimelate aminotransferase
MSYLMSTYKPLPIAISRGEGVYVWDVDGKKYLDAISGVAVCNLGHCHPAISQAILHQAQLLVHSSNLFAIPHQQTLAEKLTALTGMNNVFFCNSGAEANEAAIKLTRLYGHQQNIADPKVIVLDGAFHGRTLATLSASGNKKIKQGFEPLVDSFIRVPFNDIDAIKTAAKTHKDIVAILLEPMQGEAGVRIPDANYLSAVRQLCDEHNWLMILDEIQTGMGRTGKWFGYQHFDVQPDVITLAKALANGIPIGACVAGKKAAALFQPGNHGSTFGGNPLATYVALQTINTLEKDNIIANTKTQGESLLQQLKTGLKDVPQVKDIRGKGLWIGIELDKPAGALLPIAAEKGLLINVVQDNTIRLAPPLIITTEQVNFIAETVIEIVKSS